MDTFGDDIRSLKTDPQSKPGDEELVSMLFKKVAKSAEAFADRQPAVKGTIASKLRKVLYLVVLFTTLKHASVRNLLSRVTDKEWLIEIALTVAFIAISYLILG
jgi:hypothetical protein